MRGGINVWVCVCGRRWRPIIKTISRFADDCDLPAKMVGHDCSVHVAKCTHFSIFIPVCICICMNLYRRQTQARCQWCWYWWWWWLDDKWRPPPDGKKAVDVERPVECGGGPLLLYSKMMSMNRAAGECEEDTQRPVIWRLGGDQFNWGAIGYHSLTVGPTYQDNGSLYGADVLSLLLCGIDIWVDLEFSKADKR